MPRPSRETRSSFSCYGGALDLVAPGENVSVLSVDPDFPFIQISGTSFSAPQVAAAAAMIISFRPGLSSQQVRDIIEKTTQKIPVGTYSSTTSRPWGWNSLVGSGLLDVHAALAMADTIPVIGDHVYASSSTGRRAIDIVATRGSAPSRQHPGRLGEWLTSAVDISKKEQARRTFQVFM